jgi:hypothetical protein
MRPEVSAAIGLVPVDALVSSYPIRVSYGFRMVGYSETAGQLVKKSPHHSPTGGATKHGAVAGV